MSPKEISELDAWIAEHVMGWKIHNRNTAHYVDADKVNSSDYILRAAYNWSAVNTPNVAMEVLKKCIEHCGFFDALLIGQTADGNYFVGHNAASVEAPTIELAICLFAKKLFEK